MSYKDPKKQREYNIKYRKTSKYKKARKKYYDSSKGQAIRKKYQKNYSKSFKGRKAQQKWRNSLKGKEYQRKWNNSSKGKGAMLKYRYDIDIKEYNRLFEKQHGKCAICFKPQTYKKLAVDHNHKCCPRKKSCGKCIRGLLCDKCNIAIGFLDESTLILQRAIHYIKKYSIKRD